MDVRIYSVKAEKQAVNMWVYVITTHKEQGYTMLSLRPEIFTGNLAGGYVSIFLDTSRTANFEIHVPCKSCCNFP